MKNSWNNEKFWCDNQNFTEIRKFVELTDILTKSEFFNEKLVIFDSVKN